MAPYPSADNDTSSIPPGFTQSAEKLRVALWLCASAVPPGVSAAAARNRAAIRTTAAQLPNAFLIIKNNTLYPAK